MTSKDDVKAPETIKELLDNLDASLGDRLVGAILFGSHAKQKASDNSDIDLAIIVADMDGERSRQEVFRIFSASGADRNTVSISVESYMRIKDFLKRGDPFAWTVVSEGRILKERNGLLTGLRDYCKTISDNVTREAALPYLQNKSYSHYMQAMQAFHQFLSHIQLSEMAGAQAVAVQQTKGRISGQKLTELSDWNALKSVLQETAATRREIEALEQLVFAHKQIRVKEADYAGKDLMQLVQTAGELWQRLLPQRKTEQ